MLIKIKFPKVLSAITLIELSVLMSLGILFILSVYIFISSYTMSSNLLVGKLACVSSIKSLDSKLEVYSKEASTIYQTNSNNITFVINNNPVTFNFTNNTIYEGNEVIVYDMSNVLFNLNTSLQKATIDVEVNCHNTITNLTYTSFIN